MRFCYFRKLNVCYDPILVICRGYMAPEYVVHGQLTEKVDVYSFGVLVLEIVTGKQITKSEMSEYLVTEVS